MKGSAKALEENKDDISIERRSPKRGKINFYIYRCKEIAIFYSKHRGSIKNTQSFVFGNRLVSVIPGAYTSSEGNFL